MCTWGNLGADISKIHAHAAPQQMGGGRPHERVHKIWILTLGSLSLVHRQFCRLVLPLPSRTLLLDDEEVMVK